MNNKTAKKLLKRAIKLIQDTPRSDYYPDTTSAFEEEDGVRYHVAIWKIAPHKDTQSYGLRVDIEVDLENKC